MRCVLLVGSGDRGLVGGLVAGQEALCERRPVLRRLRRGGVRLLELLVAPVVGRAVREVRAVGRLDDAVDHHAVEQQALQRRVAVSSGGVDDLLGRDVRLARPPGRTGRRSRGRARGTARCRAASARLRCTSATSRVSAGTATSSSPSSYGDGDRAQLGVVREHGGAEARAHRQERQPLGGGAQAGLEHALVALAELARAALRGPC